MKNIIKKLKESLYLGIKKYPITIMGLALIFILSILLNEGVKLPINIEKLLLILITFIPLSLILKNYIKLREDNYIFEILGYIVVALFLIFFKQIYMLDLNTVLYTRIFILNLSLYIIYLYTVKYKSDVYVNYVIDTIKNIFISGVYGLVLLLALEFTIFTVEHLFKLNINSYIYYYVFLFIVILFIPVLFLSRNTKKDYENYSLSKYFYGIFKFILIPISYVYIFILYIYFIKIFYLREMPKDLISHLVVWFSIIQILIIFFSKNNQDSIFIIFRKYMPKLIIIPLLVLFYSVYLRVNQYGLTELRYMAFIIGMWLFIINIYLSLKDINMKLIPITLSIFLLLSAIGPISIFNISKKSQISRLNSILLKNQMLKSDKVIKKDIGEEDKSEISNILNYLSRRSYLKDVAYLPEDFELEQMKDIFGFAQKTDDYQKEIYLSINENLKLNVSDYDSLFNIQEAGLVENDNLKIAVDREIKIYKSGEEVYKKDMSFIIKNIDEKIDSEEDIRLSQMTFKDENKKIKIKIIFENLTYDKNLKDPLYYNMFILIKEK